MKIIGIITTTLITALLAPIWRGYVFSKLWLWFIVSAFGAPPLGIASSIGIGYVVQFLTQPVKAAKKDDRKYTELLIEAVLLCALHPAIALLFGWIVKQWL